MRRAGGAAVTLWWPLSYGARWRDFEGYDKPGGGGLHVISFATDAASVFATDAHFIAIRISGFGWLF